MMNGVTFGEKHSFRDWGLYLQSRPEISPPSPKTLYVKIPGSDGDLDLTESLTGGVNYNDRKIKCTFVVIEGRASWSNIYSEILDYLQGKKMDVIFDEDPDYYYTGRLSVNSWQSDKVTSTIVIEGTVEPYKYEMYGSMEEWEWDSFDFESGIIREYNNLTVDGELEMQIEGRRQPIIPSFVVSSSDGQGLQCVFKGSTYDLPDGTSRVLNIKLTEGENELHFKGHGTISIEYRGGRL